MANTRRMNRLEELGRVDSERAHTGKGARNLAAEKRRIVGELKAKGGGIAKRGKEWLTEAVATLSLWVKLQEAAE